MQQPRPSGTSTEGSDQLPPAFKAEPQPPRFEPAEPPPKKWYKNWRILLPAALLLTFLAAGVYYIARDEADAPQAPHVAESSGEIKKDDNIIRLTATGDMLPHETVNLRARTNSGYDYQQFFINVRSYFKDSDVNFCNQEAPSADGLAVTGYPSFNAPPQFAKDLNVVGCNLINLANNHSYDKGQAGIDGTLDVWEELETLTVAGINRNKEQQDKVSYFTLKGVKFAFLSYSACSNRAVANPYGLNMLDRQLTDRHLNEANNRADMIITGVHWCREDTSAQDAAQEQWASYFAHKNVDIVIGTGPHYLQPVKKLAKSEGGDTLVWFSLGNFLSTQEHINGLVGGIAMMDIDASKKTVVKIGFLPTYMHYEWTQDQKNRGQLLARQNLMLYPLDAAEEPLRRSLHNTTVQQQTERAKNLLNTYTDVPLLTSKNYPFRK